MGRPRVDERWASEAAAERYTLRRFASARAAERDPRLVARVLRERGVHGAILDAPCGTGRLHSTLRSFERPVVGADVSEAMLLQARAAGARLLVRARIDRLPFAPRAFDVVVCCRLLHHLRERSELAAAIAELVRVSDRLVLASFWDAASLPGLRSRLGLKRAVAAGRRAVPRALVAELFEAAGARGVEFRSPMRFVSQQTFAVAERR